MSYARITSISNESGGVYFDAVLDNDMKPLFNGQRNATLKWLEENPWAHVYSVCYGRTMELVSIQDYIEGKSKK